ncbi:MAG: DUF2950 family protein [Planctomycetota bacterium]|jgi:hypothetical protein
MSECPQNKKIGITGLVFTVIVTLGFIWAAAQWFNRYNWPRQLDIKGMRTNEIKTFENLQLIVQAQEKYKEADWDADKKKNYAKFLPHLWTSVGIKSEPILINLIPKELAFAAGPSSAVDGYYFINLRSRALSAKGQIRKLDYEKEWAVASEPAESGKTGSLIFIADNSGNIFSKEQIGVPSEFPDEPLSNNWTKIETIEQLKRFQKTLSHTN